MVAPNAALLALLSLLPALLSRAAPSPLSSHSPKSQDQHVNNHVHPASRSHLTPRTVLSDEQVQEWLNSRDSALRPLTLTRRDAAGIKTRHLRPVYERDGGQQQQRAMAKGKRSPAPATTQDLGEEADFSGSTPEPQRDGLGNTFDANSNLMIDAQNPDNVAPPLTDAGVVPNLKWSMSLSHSKLVTGGWVREQTITDLPPSKDIAAAELRLSPNSYRELHWHRIAEWGYMLNGTGRITAVDQDGRNYISDIRGPINGSDPDIYYFPAGVAHSIQALDEGMEILLLFTDGNFDALGTTFMLSDWLAHTPLSVVAQNFNVSTDVLENIPKQDPYAFPASAPAAPLGQSDTIAVQSPMGEIPNPFVFQLSQQNKTGETSGGWIKIQDSTNFPASENVASSLVFVEPGAMRELHWHNNDEWLYIISGQGRATAFAGAASARTFDFQPGDTGVFPAGYGSYMLNTSPTEPLIFIEIFKASRFLDFSATQWLALTPSFVTADLLNISTDVVDQFKKEKQWVVAA